MGSAFDGVGGARPCGEGGGARKSAAGEKFGAALKSETKGGGKEFGALLKTGPGDNAAPGAKLGDGGGQMAAALGMRGGDGQLEGGPRGFGGFGADKFTPDASASAAQGRGANKSESGGGLTGVKTLAAQMSGDGGRAQQGGKGEGAAAGGRQGQGLGQSSAQTSTQTPGQPSSQPSTGAPSAQGQAGASQGGQAAPAGAGQAQPGGTAQTAAGSPPSAPGQAQAQGGQSAPAGAQNAPGQPVPAQEGRAAQGPGFIALQGEAGEAAALALQQQSGEPMPEAYLEHGLIMLGGGLTQAKRRAGGDERYRPRAGYVFPPTRWAPRCLNSTGWAARPCLARACASIMKMSRFWRAA